MTVVAGAAIEVEGIAKVLGGKTAFLRKAFRGQVVGIAVGGRLADLDQALFGAAFEIAVG